MEPLWLHSEPRSFLRRLTALLPVIPSPPSDSAPWPNPSSNVKRGKQTAVGSPHVPIYASPPHVPPLTEVAILTSHDGLRRYVFNPSHPKAPSYTQAASDDGNSPELDEDEHDFMHIREDLDTVHRHLCQRGFHRVPRDKSGSTLPFELRREINAYLQEPARIITPDAPQVRILVLSVHNINDQRLQVKRSTGMVCPWSSLRTSLASSPANIITVIVLDCCKAHTVLSLLTDGANDAFPRELVLMAGTEHEVAKADKDIGSHFLFSLFEVLGAAGASGTGLGSWEDFFKLTTEELNGVPSKQDPCWYIMSSQEPSYIFYCLAAPEQPNAQSTSDRGRQHSSVQAD